MRWRSFVEQRVAMVALCMYSALVLVVPALLLLLLLSRLLSSLSFSLSHFPLQARSLSVSEAQEELAAAASL